MHRRQQRLAPGLLQVRETDGDNQKRFESLAESDDKRLNHDRLKMRLIAFSSLSRHIRPVKSDFCHLLGGVLSSMRKSVVALSLALASIALVHTQQESDS